MTTGGSSAGWAALLPRLKAALAPKYDVLRLLGHGGMAGVYLADETRLGRKAAIKVISPGLVMDPSFVARFEQEARATARLRHSNIVTIYEVDHKDDFLFIAMSYCSGRTLSAVMREDSGPLDNDVALAWLHEVASALDHAHNRGIVHRDIKPGNILLDEEGRALVTDFGIAKVADQPGLTSTGFLVGTPSYMSPEQCAGSEVTSASDQYSLGVVAYEMMTGQAPFSGATMRVIQAHLNEAPKPIREIRSDCPPDFAEAVMRMLAKDPADRWPTTTDALRAAGAQPARYGGEVHNTMARLSRQISSIQVNLATLELRPSEEFSIEAIPLDASATPLPGRSLSWSSSAPDIAEVAPDGTVIAKAPGKAVLAIRGGTAVEAIEVEVAATGVVTPAPVAQMPAPDAAPRTGTTDPLAGAVPEHEAAPPPPLPDVSTPTPTPIPRPAAEANPEATMVANTEILRQMGLDPKTPTDEAEEAPTDSGITPVVPPPDPTPLPDEIPSPPDAIPVEPSPSIEAAEPVPADVGADPADWVDEPALPNAVAAPTGSLTELFDPIKDSQLQAAMSAAEPDAPSTDGSAPESKADSDSAPPAISGPRRATAVPKKPDDKPRRLGLAMGGVAAVVATILFLVVRGGGGPATEPSVPELPETTQVSDATPGPETGPTSTPLPADSGADATSDLTDSDAEPAGPETNQATEEARPAPPQQTPETRPEARPATPEPGRIRLTGSQPAGAVVTAVGPDGRTRNLSGTTQLPAGRYRVTAIAQGYETIQTQVEVGAGATRTFAPNWVALQTSEPQTNPDPQPADPVEESPPAPTQLTAADVAQIAVQIDGFLDNLRARNVDAVLPLIPSGMRQQYNQMLTLDYSRFDVDVGQIGSPQFDGNQATVQVPTTIRSAGRGFSADSPVRFQARLVRSGGGWTLQSMTPTG